MAEAPTAAPFQSALWGAVSEERTGVIDVLLPLLHALLDLTRVGHGTRYLDVGCGSGESCRIALGRGADTTGSDVSSGMIAAATQRVPGVRFDVADMAALPYDDNTFDAITACNSVHFSEDPVKSLREIRRVCKPGGRAAIASTGEIHEYDQWAAFDAARVLLDNQWSDPFRLAAPGALESAVEEAGFTIVGNHKTLWVLNFQDVEEAWRTHRLFGPIRRAHDLHHERAHDAVVKAIQPFVRADGTVVLRQWGHHVTVTK